MQQKLGDVTQVSRIPFPCLITVEKDMCVPRLPSWILKKKTADRKVRFLSFEDLPNQDLTRYGLNGSPTAVERMFPPEKAQKQVYLEGSTEEKTKELFDILVSRKII